MTTYTYHTFKASADGTWSNVPKPEKTSVVLPLVDGSRVALSADAHYDPSPENPKEDSLHACMGTITYMGEYDIEVEWDNGALNNYKYDDLINLDNLERPARQNETYKGKYKPGLKVYLLPGFHGPHHSNPCLGSIHQCSGEILNAEQNGETHYVAVIWANGSQNTYCFKGETKAPLIETSDVEALKKFLKGNPNRAFRASARQDKPYSMHAMHVARHLDSIDLKEDSNDS